MVGEQQATSRLFLLNPGSDSASIQSQDTATVSSAFEKKDRRICFERIETPITYSKIQKHSSLFCLLFLFCSSHVSHLSSLKARAMSEPWLLSDQCDHSLILCLLTKHNVRLRNKETDIRTDQLPFTLSSLGNITQLKL